MLSQTGLEIRMFVQSFVSARNKASPLHNQPRQVLPTWNPESQEKYKKLYLERDNVELLSEEAVASAVDRISKQMTVPRVSASWTSPLLRLRIASCVSTSATANTVRHMKAIRALPMNG